MDQDVLDLVSRHQWVALAALLIGLLARVSKEDVSFPPFVVPPRWRPYFVLGLGMLSGILQAVSTGTAWKDAMLGGLVSAFAAMAGHDVVVKSMRNGRDIPVPGLMHPSKAPPAPAADPSPDTERGAPPSVPPPPPPPRLVA